jgi:Uma2 family endonuclease
MRQRRSSPHRQPLYARRGVPELWIVDLDAKLLRVFRQPRADDYLETQATPSPGVITIAALPGCTVDLSGLSGLSGLFG